MKKLTLKLEDLACPACSNKIETALKNTEGVQSVEVLFNASKAKIEYDENLTTAENIANTVEDLGYDILKIS